MNIYSYMDINMHVGEHLCNNFYTQANSVV